MLKKCLTRRRRYPENRMMPLLHPPLLSTARRRLTGLLLLTVPLLSGADEAYLREIEEEAKRQALILLTQEPSSTSPALATPAERDLDRLAMGLDVAAFEQALRQNLPGTYTSYQQFDAQRKQQIYQAYQNDNRLVSISEQVARLISKP